jgi:hypothetical protein
MSDNQLDLDSGKRPKRTHTFRKVPNLFYLEEQWCSTRLFETEKFTYPVTDPFCGIGRCAEAARLAGYSVWATDIVDRGYQYFNGVEDFLTVNRLDPDESIVSNPSFEDRILQHVIGLDPIKAALIWPLARVVAAQEWLSRAPLARVLMLTRGRPCRLATTSYQARNLRAPASSMRGWFLSADIAAHHASAGSIATSMSPF